MHTQDNYHQTLSTQTFHGPTTQPHQDPSIFICMWLPLVQVIDWVFTWNQIYHLGWNKFLAWDFRWAEFGMIYVVGSWFGERCSGSKLTYSSLVIFWGLIYVFGCQESAKTSGKKFNLIFFICLMLIFLYKIYDIAFLIAIK